MNRSHRYVIRVPSRNSLLLLALPLVLYACGEEPSTATATGTSPQFTSNSADLAWESVSANDLSGYRIYYGTAPGEYQQPYGQGITVGNVTRYTVGGLSHGTTYYFAVTAYSASNGESAYSNEVSTSLP